MALSKNKFTQLSTKNNSSILPIPSSVFSADWESSLEVFAMDLFVITLQILMIVASITYASHAIGISAKNDKIGGNSANLQDISNAKATLIKPQDFVNYVNKLEKVDSAKSCWISLAHGARAYSNCPLAANVQNALLLRNTKTADLCWDLINDKNLRSHNMLLADACIQ